MYVDAFIVGKAGMATRLSIRNSMHWLVRIFGMDLHRGHVIPWDRLDLSDPSHPGATCRRDELKERER
jgi:hypothetical protein